MHKESCLFRPLLSTATLNWFSIGCVCIMFLYTSCKRESPKGQADQAVVMQAKSSIDTTPTIRISNASNDETLLYNQDTAIREISIENISLSDLIKFAKETGQNNIDIDGLNISNNGYLKGFSENDKYFGVVEPQTDEIFRYKVYDHATKEMIEFQLESKDNLRGKWYIANSGQRAIFLPRSKGLRYFDKFDASIILPNMKILDIIETTYGYILAYYLEENETKTIVVECRDSSMQVKWNKQFQSYLIKADLHLIDDDETLCLSLMKNDVQHFDSKAVFLNSANGHMINELSIDKMTALNAKFNYARIRNKNYHFIYGSNQLYIKVFDFENDDRRFEFDGRVWDVTTFEDRIFISTYNRINKIGSVIALDERNGNHKIYEFNSNTQPIFGEQEPHLNIIYSWNDKIKADIIH